MSIHRRPTDQEFMPYYNTYISKVEGFDFVATLNQSLAKNLAKLQTLTEAQWDSKYDSDKWTVKEVLIHLLDTERIFAYRALRISRNDKTALSGFEQNDYVDFYEANSRSIPSLLEEYELLRRSTISMFKNMSNEMLDRTGTASGGTVSALALGYMIAGHEIHHWEIFEDKYEL